MASYGKRRRKQTKLSSQMLFSDDDGGEMDETSISFTTSDTIDSPRKQMVASVREFESPRKNGVVDLFDSLTSSPKKYVKVIDGILTSPNSKNIKKRLFEEKDNEVKQEAKQEVIPEVKRPILKKKENISNVWGNVFDNIHSNKPQSAKLASNEVESNVWESAFEEIEPSQSAVSIELHSDDEETNSSDCTSESEINLEFEVFEDVQGKEVVEEVVVKKKLIIPTGRTYGKVRSFRVSENVEEDDHDNDNDNDIDDEVGGYLEQNDVESQDINDLRLVSINSHIDEEMEIRLDGLNYKRHGFRLVFLELTEIINNLQQHNQTYINYGGKIYSCLHELNLKNESCQELVITWLSGVVYYYLIINKVNNVPIDLLRIINSLEIKVLDQKVVLSTIARNNLSQIYQNLPKNLLNNLIEFAPPGLMEEFEYLCEIYHSSDLGLQIEILKYFERYLSESKYIDDDLKLFVNLIDKLFNNIAGKVNSEDIYYIGKLIVVLSTNYPQYKIFDQNQPIIIFQLLNEIYQHQREYQKEVCLFLLGYLVNVVESKVWHQSPPELLNLIDKNIQLLTVATGDNIVRHMMGYNSLILSYLKLNKQVIKIESNDLIMKLEQFKEIVGNELIVGTVESVIGELEKSVRLMKETPD